MAVATIFIATAILYFVAEILFPGLAADGFRSRLPRPEAGQGDTRVLRKGLPSHPQAVTICADLHSLSPIKKLAVSV